MTRRYADEYEGDAELKRLIDDGEEVTAKIVDLNEAEKKISLSMKALEAADEETADAE